MKEIELIGKRNLREKHFLQEDGTILAKVYDNDIHYLKNGRYEEIDNTLILKDGYYTNKSNDYKVFFQEEGKNSLVKMQKDNFYLDMKLEKANSSAIETKTFDSKIVEDIIYKEILKDVNIEYRTLSNKIKETIVMKTNSYKSFSFIVDTNLLLNIENGEILARKDNDIIFKIDKPYMEDASGKINTNIYYQLNVENNKYKIELILDSDWLNSIERKFPIYIDPTITSDSDTSSLQDTYIYPGDTGVNKGTQDILKAGVEKVNGSNRVNRTLIKFGLPKIGTGSEITNAMLLLYTYPTSKNTPTANEKLATVHRITQDWNESTADWNNMNNKFEEKVEAIIPCVRASVSESFITPQLTGPELTKLVRRWYRDIPNYGIMIKSSDEIYIDEDYPAFYSKNNNVAGDPKPIFSITYRNRNGLENYYNLKKQSFLFGNTYVNTYNGNLIGVFDIGQTIGGESSVNLQLIYNTNDVILKNETSFGKGYRLNFEQIIKSVTIDGTNYLEYTDEDGTIHYFIQESYIYPLLQSNENIYIDEDGLELKIEKTNNICILCDKYGNSKTFTLQNDIYYLTKIVDTGNKETTIEMDDNYRVTKIIDSNNLEINIEYGTESININSADSVTSLCFTDNKISSIEKEEGNLLINYNENELINNIIDMTEMSMRYEYYSEKPYRLKKISQYGVNDNLGKSLTFEYDLESTTIVDNKNRYQTLIYREDGTLLSSNDVSSENDISSAYSTTEEYGYVGNNKNKVMNNAISMKYVKNYLKNTYFENNDDYFNATTNIVKSFTTETSCIGNKCLKVKSNSNNQYIEQEVEVKKGNYYTFSGYFKCNNEFTISLLYEDENGSIISRSEIIEASSEFTKEDITIFYDNNATGNLKIRIELSDSDILYIDTIQLEEGQVANAYNLVENSDFSDGLNGWNCSARHIDSITGTATEIDVDSKFEIITVDNQNVLKVKMDPDTSSFLTKTFPIEGKKDEIYNISFWYKNEGVAQYRPHTGCSLTIYCNLKEGNVASCLPELQLNRNGENWQFYTYRYKAPGDFESISFSINQIMNANNFYITNISFYKGVVSNDYTYDNNGNVVSVNNQSKEESIFKYDNRNNLVNVTDPKGKTVKYEYDLEFPDRVLSTIHNSGLTNQVVYDVYGNPIRTRTSKKHSSKLISGNYRIRSKGTAKYIKARSRDLLVESNACSNTIWKITIDEDNYKFSYAVLDNYSISYINNDLKLSVSDTNNLFKLEKNENGSYYISLSDNQEGDRYLKVNNNILTIGNEVQKDSTYEFYIENIEDEFIENSATYSDDGRFLTSLTDSNFNTTTYQTNPINGLVTAITKPNDVTTTYTYNDKKQLTKISCDSRKVEFEYNNKNLLNKIIRNNMEYNFNYDNFLNKSSVKINDNINLVTNQYENNNGNLVSTTYGNNNVISYEYDLFDRIKRIHNMDNEYEYYYDNCGNIAKLVSNENVCKYKYDGNNRLCDIKNQKFRINYSYDSNDNVTNKYFKLNNKQHYISNLYNEEDVITQTNFDDFQVNYQYDALNRLSQKQINSEYDIYYNYVRNGNKTSNLIKSIQNQNDSYYYSYDKLGNITEIYNNDVLINSYSYDQYNELILEEDYVENIKKEYEYDDLGNITTATTKSMTNNEIISVDNYQYNTTWEDQLTTFNNMQIVYDTIGNPISIGNNITMNWKNGRSLSNYNDISKNINIDYNYNVDGIRQSKIVNGVETNYYLEDNNIIYETTGNSCIYYLYDLNGLIGLEYNENKYYFIKNLQGDIISILDENNNIITTYKYDSWGNILSIKDQNGNNITDPNHIGLINPFRYKGYYYDSESNLYYLNSRYYSPEMRRFISADNYISTDTGLLGYNMYSYANNNPIMYVDYDGHAIFIGLLVGIVVVGLVVGSAIFANSVKQNKKAKKQVKKVQETKSVKQNVTQTQKFETTLKTNATTVKKETKNMQPAEKLIYFVNNVGSGKRYDLKNTSEWNDATVYYDGMIMEAQDLGNYNFGYIGRALGYDTEFLTLGAGAYQLYRKTSTIGWCLSIYTCDDPRDNYYIRLGALAYDRDNEK